jgi:O-antigen/teichoic acid export membrane protein
MGQAEAAVRNTFFRTAELLLQFVAGGVSTIIVARSLGPDRTGTYNYLLWLTALLLAPAAFGLPNTLAKYVAVFVGRNDPATARSLSRYLIAVQSGFTIVVASAAAWLLPIAFPQQPRGAIVISCAAIVPVALREAWLGFLSGVQRYDRIATSSFCTSVAQLACLGSAALLHAGLYGMLWAILVAMTIGAASTMWLALTPLRQLGSAATPLTTDFRRTTWRFAAAAFYTTLVHIILWQRSEIMFLEHYSTAAEVAFYGISYSLLQKVESVAVAISTVLLPITSESYGRHGPDKIGSLLSQSIKYLQLTVVPLCLAGAALALPAVRWAFGSDYLPMAPVIRLQLLTLAPICVGSLLYVFLMSTDRHLFVVYLWTIMSICNLGLAWIVIPGRGALASAVVKAGVQLATVVISVAYLQKVFRVQIPWRSLGSIYVSSGLAAILLLIAQRYTNHITMLFALFPLVLAIYVALLRAFGELRRGEFAITRRAFLGLMNPDPASTVAADVLP